MRYFGIYKLLGFKQNSFMIFYTKNPHIHNKCIANYYARLSDLGFFEIGNLFGVNYKPMLTFTKETYPNYKFIHTNLIKYLSKDKIQNPKSRFNYWPIINVSNKNLQKLNNLDELIAEAQRIKTKSK